MTRQIEGYWYSQHCKEYPMPIPNVLTQEQAREIHDLIKNKEKSALQVYFRGLSTSRITGEGLGCSEFQTDEWIWPADFAPHYVLQHKVKPSDDFLKYIGYKKGKL